MLCSPTFWRRPATTSIMGNGDEDVKLENLDLGKPLRFDFHKYNWRAAERETRAATALARTLRQQRQGIEAEGSLPVHVVVEGVGDECS
jgi:hypothetical protein